MKYQLIQKNAEMNLDAKLLRGWKDSNGNILGVFGVSGKKFGLARLSPGNEWYYWFGIGSDKISSDMPAGRGDYLIGRKLEEGLSDKFDPLVSSAANLESLSTRGASWAPINDSQRSELAKLINSAASINNFLSQNGLLYTGDDKIIFGEGITGEDILSVKKIEPSSDRKSDYRRTMPTGEKEWREKFYNTAASQIGIPYYWGGDDPGTGFDCSGLIHWSLDKSGLIPGAADMVAGDQLNLGERINENELAKGDFIGFRTQNGVVHIGLYTGEGTMYLSASGGGRNTKGDNPKAKVQVTDYTRYPAEKIFVSISPLIRAISKGSALVS